jgi:hypothetical protein
MAMTAFQCGAGRLKAGIFFSLDEKSAPSMA